MRWFKHFSDNHRGQTIQHLLNTHGHSGVAAYYFIMELCAEKLETKQEHFDFVFVFKRPYFDNILRMKRKSTDNILRTLSESGVIKSETNENEIKIEMPILLNLLDRDMKKPQIKRKRSAESTRSEEDKEKDVDKDIEEDKDIDNTSAFSRKTAKKPKKSEDLGLIDRREIKQAYKEAYFMRYKVEPATENEEFNRKIKGLHKKFGKDESIGLVRFYLGHNDSFYIKSMHSIGVCLLHSDALRTQMLKGKAITSTMVRQFEKQNQMQETFDQIDQMFPKEPNK